MSQKASRLSKAALALMLLLLPTVLGCETKSVTLVIPGFGSGNIDGIWLWRFVEAKGKYVRACRIELDDPTVTSSGAEEVSYLQVCDGQPGVGGMNLKATINRPPTDPNTIVVRLWYFRFAAPGQFRASAYNSAGESGLSPTAIPL